MTQDERPKHSHCNACLVCQRNKKQRKKYGHLPIKMAEAKSWDKHSVDMIGCYKIRRKSKPVLTCNCVTMITPTTEWIELHEITNQQSDTVANVGEQEWLCRYPWPT